MPNSSIFASLAVAVDTDPAKNDVLSTSRLSERNLSVHYCSIFAPLMGCLGQIQPKYRAKMGHIDSGIALSDKLLGRAEVDNIEG